MAEKTEQPTAKRKRDERKQGNLAKSREIVTTLTFIGVFFVVAFLGEKYITDFKVIMHKYLSGVGSDLLKESGEALLKDCVFSVIKIFIPLGLIIMVLGFVGHMAQTGFYFSVEGIKPKFNKINPINGLKNMFSMKALFTLAKSLVVVTAIAFIGISYLSSNMDSVIQIGNVHIQYIGSSILYIVKGLLSKVMLVVVIVGVVDVAYQFISHKKKMMMTKQEVKDEYKQTEGDPEQKARLKQKQRELSNRRMMSNVPKADVIINNPTHISVALKYEAGVDIAPIVIAKGADHMAMRIREVAKENDIPMIENIPLARSIYNNVELDKPIPVELYEDVGDVLILVRKIKNRYKK